VYSFESGHRKPEPEIFLDALDRVGVAPEQNLMVGDNLTADCIGARRVGMQAALIERETPEGDAAELETLPMGIIRVKNLTQLLPMLTS
jgi:FMN phosphatase YigB (HAD superfamily)